MNFKVLAFAFALTLVASGTSVVAQDNSNALPWRMPTAFNAYLLRDVHAQYAEREKELPKALASRRAMLKYRDDRRERYRMIMGELPQKTELHARVTGTSQQKGFRTENIIFESMPHCHVTANLYIPDGKGPFPAALVFCGHGLNGKVGEQREAVLFALNGFVVLVVDPVGQGERIQLTDSNGKSLTRGATTEHTLLNAGLNLVGTSVAACEFWDNVRALDYLESRSEVDKDRIGCIGSSGGGTQVSYFMGLEPRIKVAVVCSYVSRRERTLELSGASDGCQHIPYEGREHLEIADFLLMCAPKPVLIMSGYYDFVDYWGASQTFAELKRVYAVLGEPEKAGMFSLEGGHGMPKPKREAAVTWFRTWLYNDRTPVHESEAIVVTEKELTCTPTGQTTTSFADEITLPRYSSSLAHEYAAQRSAFMKKDPAAIKSKVLELLGVSMPTEKVSAERTGRASAGDSGPLKYQIIRKGQMPVPCLVYYPETNNPSGNVTLYLDEGGKGAVATNDSVIGAYMNAGDILVLADLRGFGETTDPSELNDPKYWNREYRNAMISLHIGRPIMGQRVVDIMSLVDFISSEPKMENHAIKLVANGAYGPAAIHAAYLDPRINETELSRSIKSFTELIDNPLQRDAYTSVLYGVLKYYDLPDLVSHAGHGRINFGDHTDGKPPAQSLFKPDLIVAADGSGDFRTVTEAVKAVPQARNERFVILVKDGVYREKIRVEANCVTLRGQSRAGTRIEYPQLDDDFNRQPDPIGRAVVNFSANDLVLENLTVANTAGVIGPHEFAISGQGDRIVIVDCDVLSEGADTIALGRGAGGRFYQARCNIRGSVDFICPRGWCYMTDCTLYEVNEAAHAMIWHDGSKDQDMKLVLRNCRFDGVEGWILARHHHDAQFFLIDCTFSKPMRDKAPYRVIYPIAGDAPKESDAKRNQDLDKSNVWGERAYFYNCHHTGGDYPWHHDNLSTAPGAPTAEQITAAWTFHGKWDPERRNGPSILKIAQSDGRITVAFNESVTVKGHPRVTLESDKFADYASGSGTDTLIFTAPAGDRLQIKTVDLNGGAIIASEAAASLLPADLSLR